MLRAVQFSFIFPRNASLLLKLCEILVTALIIFTCIPLEYKNCVVCASGAAPRP